MEVSSPVLSLGNGFYKPCGRPLVREPNLVPSTRVGRVGLGPAGPILYLTCLSAVTGHGTHVLFFVVVVVF